MVLMGFRLRHLRPTEPEEMATRTVRTDQETAETAASDCGLLEVAPVEEFNQTVVCRA